MNYRLVSKLLAWALAASLLVFPGLVAAAPETLAVLPFDLNADRDISYVKSGISRMFYSRLSWPDRVKVVPPKTMAKNLDSLKGLTGDKLIHTIAEKTGSQYIITGAITQLAGSFSIDAKVYDIPNKRFMAFFEQSKQSDDLILKVDRIAATINQKIFERSTVTWEKMEQERQKQITDYKRKNPEHLMQLPPNWQPKEEIGWKVWKYLF